MPWKKTWQMPDNREKKDPFFRIWEWLMGDRLLSAYISQRTKPLVRSLYSILHSELWTRIMWYCLQSNMTPEAHVIMAQRAMIGDVFGAKAPVEVSAIRKRNLKPSFHSLKMRHIMFQRQQNDFKPKSSAKWPRGKRFVLWLLFRQYESAVSTNPDDD